MSIESIIGLIAGLFGILTGCAWLFEVMKKRKVTKRSYTLFKSLTDKRLTDAEKRKILVKLNKTSIVKGRLNEDYINSFCWKNRGIEKLFLELCEENDIEPNDDICLDLLASRMPSLQIAYKGNKKAQENTTGQETKSSNFSIMKQTVYFSEYITAYKCWNDIKQALEANNIPFGLLPNTKDIWARDYMPIYCSGRYVIYKYNPDYLQDKKDYITKDVNAVFDFSNDTVVTADIVIDGGNVIVCGDKIIMTDKIFVENSRFSKEELIGLIEEAFKAQLVVIPWDKEERFGHADGMVRFVSKDHVLINCYKDFDLDLRTKILDALTPHFSTISELEYGKSSSINSWAHINYLQVNDIILVPQISRLSDKLAVEQISAIFPNSKIIPIEVSGIVKNGGALNCISWNHFEP
jgi:agmatine/peptidylarginine deiminase